MSVPEASAASAEAIAFKFTYVPLFPEDADKSRFSITVIDITGREQDSVIRELRKHIFDEDISQYKPDEKWDRRLVSERGISPGEVRELQLKGDSDAHFIVAVQETIVDRIINLPGSIFSREELENQFLHSTGAETFDVFQRRISEEEIYSQIMSDHSLSSGEELE